MRPDGRGPADLRPVTIETGTLRFAEGSALISAGDTRVLCSASVSEDVPQWRKGRGAGWITAEYSMLPRATKTRTPREISRGRPQGRTQEIQRLIGRSLRSVANLSALGERTVIVDCDVLQADAGTRCASITGAYVALALACQKMLSTGQLPVSFLREPVAAVSAGLSNGRSILDLDYSEDSTADVDMNVVMTASGNLVEIQGTAEASPFPEEALLQLVGLARSGIERLIQTQRDAIAAAGP